jgi:ferredoxin
MVLFIICAVLGINTVVGLLAPYSAYGRMVTSLGQPVWIWGNNLLASWAEACDSYMFSSHELWLRSLPTLVVGVVTLLAVGITAWCSGRGYCNTVCPVGTLLGYLSKWAIFRPVIDTSKCNSCGLCARNCKSHCINSKEHSVDMTRCVACFDCISRCSQGAISYRPVWKKPSAEHKSETVDNEGRRSFLTITGLAATSIAANAVQKKVDGGLAVIEDRTPPSRTTRLVPAGSLSLKNMDQRCTGCQLCISKCPNNVLRPSTSLSDMLQPTMEFDRGYCRPGCTVCSHVCPTGAITEICCKKKTSISIGYAVWVEKNCVVATDGVECGNCQRHCPTGAIMMVESQKYDGRKIPVINTDKCIGCGACEYLCPARPLGAIYVEGREVHTSR